MGGHRPMERLLAMVVAGLGVFLAAAVADAQMRVGTAVVKTVTGRAEVQRKDDAQWISTAPGARLAEGDNIRAHAASSAVLDLPDGSTLFVAENSRIVVSKLEFDPQSQARQSFVHLAVGKVRAVVSQAAITLVKARQSNFAVTTPTAVAAARGTVFEVVYDATQNVMRVAVIVKRSAAGGRAGLVPVALRPVLERPGPRGARDVGLGHLGLHAAHSDQHAPRCEPGRHAPEPDPAGPGILRAGHRPVRPGLADRGPVVFTLRSRGCSSGAPVDDRGEYRPRCRRPRGPRALPSRRSRMLKKAHLRSTASLGRRATSRARSSDRRTLVCGAQRHGPALP
mgnify:CR=1 FL=1